MARNIFEIICKKCQGKCCKSTIFLTQTDVDRLNKRHKGVFKVEKIPGIMILDESGKCPFLNESKGCILSENLKPFDCRVFPIAFIYRNGETNFYLNKKCPYHNEIPKEWIEKTKKWAKKELESWTEEEKLEFSKMIEKCPQSQLISL